MSMLILGLCLSMFQRRKMHWPCHITIFIFIKTSHFRPFDLVTWFCIFTALASVLLSFTCMNKCFGLTTKFSSMCGFLARVLVSEPTHWIPQMTNHQKVLAIITMGSFMVLAQSYSGTLVSMFTVPIFHVPINRYKCYIILVWYHVMIWLTYSLEDLVSQSELPWTIEAGSMMENAAKAAKKNSLLGFGNNTIVFLNLLHDLFYHFYG